MSLTLPIAHAGHFLWLIYVVPFIAVVLAIARSMIEQRREARQKEEEVAGE